MNLITLKFHPVAQSCHHHLPKQASQPSPSHASLPRHHHCLIVFPSLSSFPSTFIIHQTIYLHLHFHFMLLTLVLPSSSSPPPTTHVQGRNGLGNIYVWASGDGGEDDDCNCDGYAASMWTISINSAINDGSNAHYDESCSSTLASTFSNGAKDPSTGVVSC